MIVQCPHCWLWFDSAARRGICPHVPFPMSPANNSTYLSTGQQVIPPVPPPSTVIIPGVYKP